MDLKIKLALNKFDIILSSIIFLLALFFIIKMAFTTTNTSQKADVFYQNKQIATLDLNVNGEYDYQATNGLIVVEVKNKKIRILEEKSKNNICSIQGFVSSSLTPLVCLPNEFYIQISANDEEVDVFIK